MTALEGYLIPAARHRTEEVILRSRFLTTLAPAPDEQSARAVVQAVRAEFPEATHHCWAFVTGPPASTASIGMSDDGEPHGTAGRPMLTTLLHSGVGEIVAVCTRWYGGTKLGTGGLGRAYAGGVRQALDTLPTVQRVERTLLEIEVGYPQVASLQRLLSGLDARIEEEAYGASVIYRVALPGVHLPRFEREMADLTAGSGHIRLLD